MDVTVQNKEFEADGIFGVMIDGNGREFLKTLQHSYDSGLGNGTYLPKIPNGTYLCKRRLSPHFGFDVFELQDVPNCIAIEIHPGNYNKDSEGCILLGTDLAPGMVTHSKDAFDRFMKLQENINEFNITIK